MSVTPLDIQRIFGRPEDYPESQAAVNAYRFDKTPQSEPYLEHIRATEQKYGIPENLLARMIEQESNFDPAAVSKKGARGIAQIVPKWHPDANPDDPFQAIEYSGGYLRQNADMFSKDGRPDWRLGLAGYNAGPNAVSKYGDVPPFPETQDYVKRVHDDGLMAAPAPAPESQTATPEYMMSLFNQAGPPPQAGTDRPQRRSNGFLSSVVGDVAGGLIDMVEMYGRAGRALPGGERAGADEGGIMSSVINWAERTRQENPWLDNDPGRKGFSRWFHQGLRSAVTSLATRLPATVTGALIGSNAGPIGTLIGGFMGYATSGATTFGMSEYDQVLADAKAAGVDPDMAEAAAVRSGLYEGGFELAGDLLEAATLGTAKIATVAGKQALKQGVASLFKTNVRDAVKRFAGVTAIETGTELITGGLQAEESYKIGLGDARFMEGAIEAFGPSLVASMIFAGLGTGGSIKFRQAAKNTLADPTAKPKDRMMYADVVAQEINTQSPEVAQSWRAVAQMAIENGQALDLDAPIATDAELDQRIANDEELAEASLDRALTALQEPIENDIKVFEESIDQGGLPSDDAADAIITKTASGLGSDSQIDESEPQPPLPGADEPQADENPFTAYLAPIIEKARAGDNEAVADIRNLTKMAERMEAGDTDSDFVKEVMGQHPDLAKQLGIDIESKAAKPKAPAADGYLDPRNNKLMRVDEEGGGKFTFYKTDDLGKKGTRVKAKTPISFDTREEAEAALSEYAAGRKFTPMPQDKYGQHLKDEEADKQKRLLEIPEGLQPVADLAKGYDSFGEFSRAIEDGTITEKSGIPEADIRKMILDHGKKYGAFQGSSGLYRAAKGPDYGPMFKAKAKAEPQTIAVNNVTVTDLKGKDGSWNIELDVAGNKAVKQAFDAAQDGPWPTQVVDKEDGKWYGKLINNDQSVTLKLGPFDDAGKAKDSLHQLHMGMGAATIKGYKPPAAPRTAIEYQSGVDRTGAIKGMREAGQTHLAANVQDISGKAMAELVDHANAGGSLLLDNGAFGAFKKGVTLDDVAIDKALARYEQAAAKMKKPGNLTVIAPDVVGDQSMTLNLLEDKKEALGKLIKKGVNVILPVQKGATGAGQMWASMTDIIAPGADHKQLIAGIPSNAKAFSYHDFASLFKDPKTAPKRIHLLGMGKHNSRYKTIMKLIPEGVEVTLDATGLRTKVAAIKEETGPLQEDRAAEKVVDDETEDDVIPEWIMPRVMQWGTQELGMEDDTEVFNELEGYKWDAEVVESAVAFFKLDEDQADELRAAENNTFRTFQKILVKEIGFNDDPGKFLTKGEKGKIRAKAVAKVMKAEPKAGTPEIVLDEKTGELAKAAYSGDRIGQGKIRKPFKYDGKLWTTSGIHYLKGTFQTESYQLVPENEYQGKINKKVPYSYESVPVSYGKTNYVMTNKHKFSNQEYVDSQAKKRIEEAAQNRVKELEHAAHAAASNRWEVAAKEEADKRGLKNPRFLKYAQGSSAEPKWSKDLYKKLYQEELAKRQGQIDTVKKKAERATPPKAKAKPAAPAPPSFDSFVAEQLAKEKTGIMVTDAFEDTDTGKIVEGQTDVVVAIQEVDAEIATYNRLLDCLI